MFCMVFTMIAINRFKIVKVATRMNGIKSLRLFFGTLRPKDVTRVDVYTYLDKRGAPVRANREKALLSDVFSIAIRWGIVTDNPCWGVKRNPEKPRDRYVEDFEHETVWKAAPMLVQG